MNEFTVEITVTMSKMVVIEADNAAEAIYQAREMYLNEEIVLIDGDDCDVDFNIV